jgi:hypothetical protein
VKNESDFLFVVLKKTIIVKLGIIFDRHCHFFGRSEKKTLACFASFYPYFQSKIVILSNLTSQEHEKQKTSHSGIVQSIQGRVK